MQMYPIMLSLQGRQTVVVGGGPVALRKVRSLLAAGAKVKMVADDVSDRSELAGVEVIEGRYAPEHLAGAALVFACTDDEAVNARIAADARRAGAIVNCVDQPADCDFFVPAVVSDGDVVVAIGTGGAAPALAGRLKQCIADALPARIGAFAAALAQMRRRVRRQVDPIDRRGEIMKALASEAGYEAFIADGLEGLAAICDRWIRQEPS